jgi:L-alanine-DL-glutamate epimerase-like enolase superfamily enzyme
MAWQGDILNPDGTMTVPREPGIGVEVDRERLEEVTIRREVARLS